MGVLIFFTIFVLLYANIIRYFELRMYTTMLDWRDYFIHMNGIAYNLNIILVAIIIIVAKYIN